jgi:hypothetical protein
LNRITENHLLASDTSLIEWKEESPKKKLKTVRRIFYFKFYLIGELFSKKLNNINDEVYLLLATLRLLLLPNSKINLIQSWKWNTLIHLLENNNDENVKWFV